LIYCPFFPQNSNKDFSYYPLYYLPLKNLINIKFSNGLKNIYFPIFFLMKSIDQFLKFPEKIITNENNHENEIIPIFRPMDSS